MPLKGITYSFICQSRPKSAEKHITQERVTESILKKFEGNPALTGKYFVIQFKIIHWTKHLYLLRRFRSTF